MVAKTRRNLEADVTLFCDVLCDTDLQRVFTPDDREQVLAVYGPVHARLLRQALELIAEGRIRTLLYPSRTLVYFGQRHF